MADQFDADAGFLRSTGSGRNHDALGMHRLNLLNGHFVVTANFDLRAQFAQVLDEVVSERIVVVEDEDHVSIVDAESRNKGQVAKFQSFKVSMKTARAAGSESWLVFRNIEPLKP
jgi:hypothetical protein